MWLSNQVPISCIFFGATPVLYIKCIDVAVKAQFIVRIEIVFKNIESKWKT